MADPYDREKNGGSTRLIPDDSPESLHRATGISPHDHADELAEMERREYDEKAAGLREPGTESSAIAGSVVAGIHDQAKGTPDTTPGAKPHNDLSSTGSGASKDKDSKAESAGSLNTLEKSIKPAAAAADPIEAIGGGDKSKPKSGWAKLSRRKRFTITGVVLSVLLGGGGLGGLAVVSGPLQIIHAGQLFSKLHLDPKVGQGEDRTIKALRNLKYLKKNEPQKTHMSTRANKIADKIEVKFNSAGITSTYSKSGAFTGYEIDTDKLKGTDYDSIDKNNPEEVKKYLKENYGIDATGTGKKLQVNGKGLGWTQERQLLRSTMKLAGYKGTTGAINSRIMGKRNLVGFHPIKKLDKRVKDKQSELFDKWKKQMRERIRNGTKTPTPTVEGRKNQNGQPEPGSEGNQSETEKLIQQANEAGAAAADGQPGALEGLKGNIGGKLNAGTGLVGILCLAQYIASHIDEINQVNVVMPMLRMGMDIIAMGNQIQNGKDVDETQVGFMANLMFDNHVKGKESSWTDARSLQAELHQPLSGPDIPASAKINHDGNIVTRLIDLVPGVQKVCDAANSTVGTVLIIGLGVIVTGPFSTIVSTLVGAAGTPLLTDYLAKVFAAAVVNPVAEGAERGNFMNYGARLAGRDIALSNGGLPITEAEHNNLKYAEANIEDHDFREKSLAYRLFNPEDSQSFIAQVIDWQAPDPMTNIARAGGSLLNIGHTLGSLFTMPFNRSLSAAAASTYDYGFPDYAYTSAELNDQRFSNPFQNADASAAILDANTIATSTAPPAPAGTPPPVYTAAGVVDPMVAAAKQDASNYVWRAKKCFGVGLERVTVDNGLTVIPRFTMQWNVKPPEPNATPLQRDIDLTENKCKDKSEQWSRIRFFIFDSNMTNALACYESVGDDPDLTQACVDVGQEAGTPAASAATNAPGSVDLSKWKLTLPTGTNGSPREVTQPELATFSDPTYFHDADGGKLFHVDAGGATTSGSNNPRTELREMAGPDGKTNASWGSASGTHEMTITQKVTKIDTANKSVVLGQIHDANNDIAVFRLEGTNLWITDGNTTHGHLLTDAYQLNTSFTVGFKVSAGAIHFTYNGTEVPYVQNKSAPSGWYFKAGNYLQSSKGGCPAGLPAGQKCGADVVITGLQVTHTPALP